MSKLHALILYKDRIKKIKDSTNFVDSNIALLIFQNSELKGDNELNEDFISNTVEWSRVLVTWFLMIEDEENANQLYYEDDELDMTNLTTSQNLLNTTHSADNKWWLEDLFVTNLIVPHYIIEAEKREMLRKQKEIEFIRDENRIKINENRIEIDENRIEIEDNNKSLADSNNDKLMDED
ncbi:hypothetical protein F8M41_025641 [Gigaspora margarita]|uniref:Uncharacterized protein n=1 Tax=Gigaspora margarita TaxID=4874 RepID=A0A8H4AAX5_GIGMA|nr:hypothetical protein F8M41_025641 [Gigaspora margarita]